MEQFYADDLCVFKSNPLLKGTVSHTWRDIDQAPFSGSKKCYVHKSIPKKIREEFLDYELPPKGYVIVAFIEPRINYCLVSESSLKLVDRNLALGDVVKRQPTDASSGMVISTALWCNLQPSFIGVQNGVRDLSPAESNQDRLTGQQVLCVPAQEVKFWKVYREDDYIIYHGWVGVVTEIYDEVIVRLSNGSVVVVEEPEELEEILLAPGTESERNKKRLESAGYLRQRPHSSHVDHGNSCPAQPCYPGQNVVTKKGNLRRGRWIFGAYNPTVEPKGAVVDVRTIRLQVSWAFPDVLSKEPRTLKNSPPTHLDTDVLQSGEVKIYNHNNVPGNPGVPSLPNSCHCQDTRFGLHVRFRDEAGAAVKYGGSTQNGSCQDWPFKEKITTGKYRRIPRTESQGYDMNVLQINGTRTKVMIQWQDGSVTVEDSTSVVPYLNVDDHDLWLGEIVSLKDGEVTGARHGGILARKVGVVQSTDAVERIAKVRWFEKPDLLIVGDDHSVLLSDSRLGPISNEISEVSLYDVVAYPALTKTRGDIVLIIPQTTTAPVAQTSSMTRFLIDSVKEGFAVRGGGFYLMRRHIEAALQAFRREPAESPANPQNGQIQLSSDIIDWFGEVVGLDLDGQLVVRLGALPEARDIRVPVNGVIVVASGDDMSFSGSEDGEDESGSSDEDMAMSDTNPDDSSAEAIETVYEYDDGRRHDADGDEDLEMWTTDEEDASLIDTSMNEPTPDEIPDATVNDINNSTEILENNDSEGKTPSPQLAGGWHSIGSEIRFPSYPNMLPQFLVLFDPAPSDHHYFASPSTLTAHLMRRIAKEHKILRSSLPDGIFVRTWDSRLDLLRVLIVGARNTPYELAPFVMDFQFSADFPKVPPDAFFHSWTGGIGRINPNLYEDGKICLSLLGTWPGDESNESWSPTGSSMLQIIVSLLGLVLVKEPYYNEAGFAILHGTPDSLTPSALYTEKAFVLSKLFLKTALSHPPSGLADIIHWIYSPLQAAGPNLLRVVVAECRALMSEFKEFREDGTSGVKENVRAGTGGRLSSGALVLLRRNLEWLEKWLEREERGEREVVGR